MGTRGDELGKSHFEPPNAVFCLLSVPKWPKSAPFGDQEMVETGQSVSDRG